MRRNRRLLGRHMAEDWQNLPQEPLGPSVLMSLADVLTSVFGATIVLLMLFLVLIKLDPQRQALATANETNATQALIASESQGNTSVTLILQAQSPCEQVGNLIASGSETQIWRREIKKKCQYVVYLPNGLQGTVSLSGVRPGTELQLRALMGTSSKSTALKVPDSVGEKGEGPFMQLLADGTIHAEGPNP